MHSKEAELFKVLGVESRIRIIQLLKRKGPLCLNEMSEMLGITASAVSQHLKILKHAGLVRNERKGYWIPYEIDPVALKECGKLLSGVCTCGCEGSWRAHESEVSKVQDKVALLRKYERELQNRLEKVRRQIEELKREE